MMEEQSEIRCQWKCEGISEKERLKHHLNRIIRHELLQTPSVSGKSWHTVSDYVYKTLNAGLIYTRDEW